MSAGTIIILTPPNLAEQQQMQQQAPSALFYGVITRSGLVQAAAAISAKIADIDANGIPENHLDEE